MTTEEKQEISRLRKAGAGYTRIANELGINVNTVKTFCRRNGLTGDMPEQLPGITEQPCRQCGRPVVQYPGRREKKFCSDVCRNRWWNGHLGEAERENMATHPCPVCGSEFHAYGSRNRKYCSHACYIRARFGGAE